MKKPTKVSSFILIIVVICIIAVLTFNHQKENSNKGSAPFILPKEWVSVEMNKKEYTKFKIQYINYDYQVHYDDIKGDNRKIIITVENKEERSELVDDFRSKGYLIKVTDSLTDVKKYKY